MRLWQLQCIQETRTSDGVTADARNWCPRCQVHGAPRVEVMRRPPLKSALLRSTVGNHRQPESARYQPSRLGIYTNFPFQIRIILRISTCRRIIPCIWHILRTSAMTAEMSIYSLYNGVYMCRQTRIQRIYQVLQFCNNTLSNQAINS